jgi:hypothetical protein
MQAFALEEDLIRRTAVTNKNISPGEFSIRFPEADLSANAQDAYRGPTVEFEIDIKP